MSDHGLKLDFERVGWGPQMSIVCSAPADSWCRVEWHCECESWSMQGLDPVLGPWHLAYDSHLDDMVKHYGKPGGECAYALSINDSGCVDELGGGTATVPVDMEWDGDGWCWSFSE